MLSLYDQTRTDQKSITKAMTAHPDVDGALPFAVQARGSRHLSTTSDASVAGSWEIV
jgi:hypothetical protein